MQPCTDTCVTSSGGYNLRPDERWLLAGRRSFHISKENSPNQQQTERGPTQLLSGQITGRPRYSLHGCQPRVRLQAHTNGKLGGKQHRLWENLELKLKDSLSRVSF